VILGKKKKTELLHQECVIPISAGGWVWLSITGRAHATPRASYN